MVQHSTHLSPSSIVSRSESQLSCRVDDEEVIMSLDSGEYFGCDPVGARVWALIEAPISVSALCERLAVDFPDATVDRCMSDVLPFLRELIDEGLATTTGGDASA